VLFEDKNAVIYRDGGKLGGAVAREGARIFLTGRALESLEEVAEEIAPSRTSKDRRDKKGSLEVEFHV
jgi:NADP-dependent 3-hydroxy acid dehydrogenase YdfG